MAKPQPPVKKRSPRRARRSPVGSSPGTMIAHPLARPSELTLTLIEPGGQRVIEKATLKDLEDHCHRYPLIWLDVAGLASVDLIAEIGVMFGLHTLALEDAINTGQRPKVDFFDDHAFVVLSMIDDVRTSRYEQIAVFFGDDFVITFQEREGDPFDPVRKRLATDGISRLRNRKADYLAYALIDAVVDSFFPVLEATAEEIDRIEDEILRRPQKNHVLDLHELRREMIVMKRALWPLRDAVAGLSRAERPFVTPETKVYLNDTLDHATSLIEIVETHRDVLTGLIDMHLSLGQARTSDVISVLTIVTSIFIPLTFLAGIWGMNFDPDSSPWNMPELRAWYGYPAALGFMAFVAIMLAIYFKWRKWL